MLKLQTATQSARLCPGPLSTRGRFLKDAQDRTVILHGVNVSGRHKQPPHVIPLLAPYLDPLARFGLSVARLVLVWEAIEPEPGRYDESYLDRVYALAEALTARGLHVIADMHQDIYSRHFGGSGAPLWSIAPEDRPQSPLPDNKFWFLSYAGSEPVRRSLARFFSDTDLQGHFVKALAHVAKRLSPIPGVIGCELYNEPFGGSLPFETFEQDHLQPFYQRAIGAVRQVVPSWLIFFEGAVLQSEQGTKLTLSGDGLVYDPHFYDKTTFMTNKYQGDQHEMRTVLATYEADAARLGVPWLLGEYGLTPKAEGAYAYLRDQQQCLEERLVGGTCWHYNPTEQDWNDERMSLVDPPTEPFAEPVETALVDALCRPYPRAVSGELLSYGFVDQEKTFHLRYQTTGRERADTLIYVPRRHYPSGFVVTTNPIEPTPTLELEEDPDAQLLVIRPSDRALCIDLRVTPKP